jgi:hypothetical protein
VLLWTLALLTAAWLGVLDVTRYFWDAYPAALRESAVFVRGTGGAILDDTLILANIRHAAAELPRGLPALCLALLAVLSTVCCWYGANGPRRPTRAPGRSL